jgi:hypothetical protein
MSDEVAMNQHHTLLISAESAFKTPVTPAKDIGLVETFSLNESNNTEPIMGSGSRAVQSLADGQYVSSVNITGVFQHGRILEYVFGGTTTHAATSSDTKHTFTVSTDTKSFTLGHSYNLSTDVVRTWAGCKVDSLTIEWSLGGKITFNANVLMATVADTASALAAVLSTLNAFKGQHVSLKTGTDSSEATVGKLQSFRITFNNQAERIDGAGSRVAENILPNVQLIEWEFTKAFDSVTEYERFLGSTSPAASGTTAFSMIFNANNGVTLGSGRQELNIDITVNKYETYGESKQLKGKVIQTFKGLGTTINDLFVVDNIASGAW